MKTINTLKIAQNARLAVNAFGLISVVMFFINIAF
jgi:hypothetical protein